MTEEIEQNKRPVLGGLERHHIGWFPPITFLKRTESIKESLKKLKADDSWRINTGRFTSATSLYKTSSSGFESLIQALTEDGKFEKIEVLHESSVLGFAYKIHALDKSGKSIYYDGVLYRVTESVYEGDFEIDKINELAGYPSRSTDIVDSFQKCLRKVIPDLPEYSLTISSFYTVRHIDWDALGLQNPENGKLRLICKDTNIITITAIIFSERGKDYNVYLGDRDEVLQMIAHDFYVQIQLEDVINYFEKMRNEVERINDKGIIEFRGMIAPFYSLYKKHQQWNSVKNSINSLFPIASGVSKGELLVQSFDQLVEKRWSFFNGPRQIWLPGEERDDQEKVQHPCNNYFEARLKNNKIQDLSDKPSLLGYAYSVKTLEKIIKLLREETDSTLRNEKDLLGAFQTEFSVYAVWFAIFALIISLVSIAISALQH
jgi:hypothetical protein